MSHCTKFDFQYTSRKCIIRSFETLGLSWKDSTVAYYSSTITKKLGIGGTNETPAIIAERNGFHYFMENLGNHYKLSMEKHNMSYNEGQIARTMADEFRKTYIKEVAEEVVQKMNTQGHQALLTETDSGYEIKFGLVYDKSILIKFNNGRVIEEVQGVKGEGCVSLTEALENMLSSADVELQSEWTNEYYETPDNELTVYNLDQI